MKQLSRIISFTLAFQVLVISTFSQPLVKVKKSDLKKDVEMVTDSGTFVIRLSDSTPLHRNNFIQLVKSKFYEGIAFHRIISGFMIQAGDEKTRVNADSTLFMKDYTLPAEFVPSLFHKKGVIAAARWGDEIGRAHV